MENQSHQQGFTFTTKLAVIAFIMAATLGYSLFEKRKIERLTDRENYLILKKLPDFSVQVINSQYQDEEWITQENIFNKGQRAALIHFWGTWCAPCEAELPEFINFVKKFQSNDFIVVLLAVNDEDAKIKKFLKRFGPLPENFVVAHDKSGKSMINFGTVKVPETYLFAKSGKSLNKFIGPQDWAHHSFVDRFNFYLSSIGEHTQNGKIESH